MKNTTIFLPFGGAAQWNVPEILLHIMCVTIDGVFGLVIGFIDHLYARLGTTGNYSVIDNHHNSQITTAPAKHFPVCCVFTSRSMVTDSISGDSSASAFKTSMVAPFQLPRFFTACHIEVTWLPELSSL
jgi:hypothetical protein